MIIKIILLLFFIFALSRVVIKYKDRNINLGELIFWVLFWIIAGIIVILPEATSFIAQKVGIGRGADLVIYASIVLLFYMIFRMFVRFEKMEKNITKIVREIAVRGESSEPKTENRKQT